MFRKTLTIAAAALTTTAAPVLAGSIAEPVIEPAPIAPVAPVAPASPNWTGGYVGAGLGYGDMDANPGPSEDGFLGGLTAGYDYDFGSFVLGGGLDYDFTDISFAGGADVDSIWRVKLRGGYKIGNGLLYATGGYAGIDIDTVGDGDGYFAGAGYEHMLTENVSVGGEVLYHEFDNIGSTTTDIDGTTYQVKANYRF